MTEEEVNAAGYEVFLAYTTNPIYVYIYIYRYIDIDIYICIYIYIDRYMFI